MGGFSTYQKVGKMKRITISILGYCLLLLSVYLLGCGYAVMGISMLAVSVGVLFFRITDDDDDTTD